MAERETPWARVRKAGAEGAKDGLKTALWLLAIMLPVSFAVTLLRWFGVIDAIGQALGPAFATLGLPGSSSLVIVSSLLINPYSAIAVMGQLTLSMREATILAVMSLITHNFLVEIPVLSTTGSRPLRMIGLRLVAAVIAGFALSRLLPAELASRSLGIVGAAESITEGSRFVDVVADWAISSLRLTGRVAGILLALMISERILAEFGVVRWIGKRLGVMMRLFGLPEQTAFLWVVTNTIGLGFGSGIVRREVRDGNLDPADGDLLNHHIAIAHSLFEDTLLFLALGIGALWLILPRLVLAIASVWERRLELFIRGRRDTISS